MLTGSLRDLRYALRHLTKSPIFTLCVVLTFMLGIGATTTIFTMVYDVLLRPLHYPHSDRLVVLEEQAAQWRDLYPTLPVSANNFTFWQTHSQSFSSLAAMLPESLPLHSTGRPVRIGVLKTTASFFSVFQIVPQIGRSFVMREDQLGQDRVVVLMDDLWKRQFNGDPHILGKTIQLDGWPYTIIGIMPKSFHLPVSKSISTYVGKDEPMEAIIPLAFSAEQLQEKAGDYLYFSVGRLKPDVSLTTANEEIDALQRTISRDLPATEKIDLSAKLTSFQDYLVGKDRKPLYILLVAVMGILLIGCINITNLLLARFVARRRELALRIALGASRAQVMRTATLEAILLAVLGGILGLVAASFAVPLLQRYMPSELNFSGPLHVNMLSAVCTFVLIGLATVLSGMVPAWVSSSKTSPQEVLRSESRSTSESRESKYLRKVLVGVEVAMGVVLLLLTGLLSTSLIHLLRVHRGFDSDNILTSKILLPHEEYASAEARTAFYQQVTERLKQLPGVKDAAVVSTLPLDGDPWNAMAIRPGDTRPLLEQPIAHYRWVSSGYSNTLHIPLIAGRFFSHSDFGHRDAVISEQTAKTLWGNQNPIGREFYDDPEKKPYVVLGVVADAQMIHLKGQAPLMVYVPYWVSSGNAGAIAVRTALQPMAIADVLRKTVWGINPQIAMPTIRTLNRIVTDSVQQRLFETYLLTLFAICALLLASLGVYGVVAYSVLQRTQEIGVRFALGAQKADIYKLVLWDGLSPVLLGAAAGIAIAFGVGRLMASLLFGVSPYDPLITIASVSILVIVGIAACLMPTWRAAQIDPVEALQT